MAQLFCSPEDLGDALGAHSFTPDQLVDFCTRASGRVQESVGDFWPFPDYNAQVPCPETVREAADSYALYLALKKQGRDNLVDDDGNTISPRARFDELTEFMRTDPEALVSVTVANEVLAFGSLNLSGFENAHVLAYQGAEVVETSPTIAGKLLGRDYSVDFDETRGTFKWLLWRASEDSLSDGDLVTYQVSWRKRRQIDVSPADRFGTVRIRLG